MPARDPLEPDAIERFLDRHGLARILAGGVVLSVTFGLALLGAVLLLGGLWVTAEAVAPSVPEAILNLGSSRPAHTERIAPAAKSIPASPAGQVVAGERVPSPLAATSAQGAAAAPWASPVPGSVPAAPGTSWASILTPSAPVPGTSPLLPTPAPVGAPAVQPSPVPATSTSEPAPAASEPAPVPSTTVATTTTSATIEPAPAPSSSTTATPTPAPTTVDATEDGWHGRGRHCPPARHKRDRC